MLHTFFLTLSFVIFLYWLSRIPHFLPRALETLPRLKQKSQASVSIIIAARDEAEYLEKSLRTLKVIDHPHYEIIVVNDRSRDGTREILDRLALEDKRVIAVHNEVLPEGWLGKCWAVHEGTRRSKGDWLLFTDGDILFEPETLSQALAVAESRGYDHLCLAPRIVSTSPLQEAVTQSLALLFFLFQDPRHVFDKDKPKAYMGIGAFNLVKRPVYESFGGHDSLRLEVVDDVFLGMLVKRSGGRSSFFLGPDSARVHWYAGLWAYIKGLEKNAYAGLRFSPFLLAFALIGQIIIFFVPIFLLALGDIITRVFAGLSLLLAHSLFMATCVRQGSRAFHAFLLLPAILIQFFTFTRSAVMITKRGGVVWRDTFYPLSELKAAQRKLRGSIF